ncbi:UvrD-helicase domain-containing protein [bacterium]|jgi:ATP-dependent helicase/nuclease subunit A|nr:UvrD-helicase domain-containing protein [bacterium]
MCKQVQWQIDNSKSATTEQRKAANPDKSILLRASAGSGKTKVLIDRIVRLLLDGADLKSIVALTFTKKAATEIQKRLLVRFREYVIADDNELRDKLNKMTGDEPTEENCTRARVLYEEMLDDQAGLQIGTIHSWCQGLLNRFADEANVDPSFVVIEETDELWEEAVAKLEKEFSSDKPALAELAKLGKKPGSVRDKLKEVLNNRVEIDRWSDKVADQNNVAVPLDKRTDLFNELVTDLLDNVYGKGGIKEQSDVIAFAKNCAIQLKTDLSKLEDVEGDDPTKGFIKKMAEFRSTIDSIAELNDSNPAILTRLKILILTGTGTLRVISGRKQNKELRSEVFYEICKDSLLAFALFDIICIVEKNIIQLKYGLRAVDIYDSLKARDRVLDFHDLERKTRELLHGDFNLSQWIKYRTDCGIKHFLVDEFQDTNRVQWDILKPFMDEIICAEDDRTLFLVGDVKQSIYRFRGACPEIFGEVATKYRDITEQLNLPTNFRSTKLLVDKTGEIFQKNVLSELLPDGEIENVKQLPYRNDTPGRIVYHTIAEEGELTQRREAVAKHAANIVQQLLKTDYKPRDILILSRYRTSIKYYEEALRAIGVPFVPSGRGALAETCEINDILNLLRWLMYRDDDAALAGVLRSPIFRFSQADLQELLTFRLRSNKTLWEELSEHKLQWPELIYLLNEWLHCAGNSSSHSLLRVIFQSDLLDRYEAALGEQSRYNLLRLFDLALEHDNTKFPTTRGFINKIEQSALRKNQDEGALPETTEGRLQILTVHGAKGLEAPVVLYVDAASPIRKDESEAHLTTNNDKHPDCGPVITGIKKIHRQPAGDVETNLSQVVVEAQKKNEKEEANLLYVAMTRARDVLHILGSEPKHKGNSSPLKWIAQTEELADWDESADSSELEKPEIKFSDKPIAWSPPDTETARVDVSNPSATDGTDDKNIDEKDNENRLEHKKQAAIRGTRIHLLLELATQNNQAPTGNSSESQEAARVFSNPDLQWIFNAKNGLNEVPFIHGSKSGKQVYGIIDRMIIEDDAIHIIDYKSNRVDEKTIDIKVDFYKPQMEAYRSAVKKIYPGRDIKTYLLFTAMNKGKLVKLT